MVGLKTRIVIDAIVKHNVLSQQASPSAAMWLIHITWQHT